VVGTYLAAGREHGSHLAGDCARAPGHVSPSVAQRRIAGGHRGVVPSHVAPNLCRVVVAEPPVELNHRGMRVVGDVSPLRTRSAAHRALALTARQAVALFHVAQVAKLQQGV